MQLYTVYFTCKLLHILRVVSPPIIRSTNNCIYSTWYWSTVVATGRYRGGVETAVSSPPDCSLNSSRLQSQLLQTAVSAPPDCSLNSSRLQSQLLQTAVSTPPDCSLNSSRLLSQLLQTAVSTPPDCSLNSSRLQSQLLQTAVSTPPRYRPVATTVDQYQML